MTEGWSDELRKRTREALEEGTVETRGGFLFLKRWDGTYGTIPAADVLSRPLRVTNAKSGARQDFTTVENLLAGGWVLD